jgi:hypothetical protein
MEERYYVLEPQLDWLRNIWEDCSARKSRYAFYRYLQAAYKLMTRLKHFEQEDWAVRTILADKTKTHYDNDLAGALINATCSADRKSRSRWSQALRFINHLQTSNGSFLSTLKRYGGPAGCSRQYSQIRPARPRTPHYRGPAGRLCTKSQLNENKRARLIERLQRLPIRAVVPGKLIQPET